MDSRSKLAMTVVILTKNEEETVREAIASTIEDYAEVVVLDSFSADRTVDMANAAGARVVQNAFKGYASQRNFALHNMEKATDWVFFLDADERVSAELTAELHRDFAKKATEGIGMLYVRRKDMFDGRWIRRSSGYPTWFGRICHSPSVQVMREINEEYHCVRAVGRLHEHLVHYPFAKGIGQWLERHNRYSSAEAETMTATDAAAATPTNTLRLVFSREPGFRRRALKRVYMSLPFRPLAGFLYLYIFKGGFLEGRAGLRFAMLRAFYELMISIKRDEIMAVEIEVKKKIL